MKILIQYQTPSKIIYNGVEYNSLGKFATKNKIYDKNKRNLLFKFINTHFKKENGAYNIDEAPAYNKRVFDLYLDGKISRPSESVIIKYKNEVYVSIKDFARSIGFSSAEILRELKNQKYKRGEIFVIKKSLEKSIDEKIKRKKEGKRRDHIKVIYNNLSFKSIVCMARFIEINESSLQKYVKKHGKYENFEIDLNKKENLEVRRFIEKKDVHKKLIPFDEKIKELSLQKEIPINSIYTFIQNKNIKDFDVLKKYYQHVLGV